MSHRNVRRILHQALPLLAFSIWAFNDTFSHSFCISCRQKMKKPTNLIVNKSTTPTQNPQTASTTPKFVPGSSPLRPPVEESANKERTEAASQPVKPDHSYAEKQPSKPSVSPQSGSVSKLGEVKVTSDAVGLSLLASSAASQKYLDKSWGHEVNDILRASLTSHVPENKKKVDQPTTSSKSFMEQFQNFASTMIQRQLSEEASKSQEVSPKKKDLTLETKSYTQQQLLNKLQSVAAHQAKPDTPSYSHLPVVKPEVKSYAPPAHQNKPQTGLSTQPPSTKRPSISDEVYRKFLMESGVQLPPAHTNKPNSPSITHGASGPIRVSTSEPKSDKTKTIVMYPSASSTSRPAQSIYNTQSAPRIVQTAAGTPTGQGTSQVKVSPVSRTSPMQIQRPVAQSSMSPSNQVPKMDTKTAELIQQMIFSEVSKSASSHSQVNQISPSSYLGKPVSPSSLYKSTPQPRVSPQNWNVSSITAKHKPNVGGIVSSSLSNHNPTPGYQALKLSSFPRDPGASTSIPPLPVVSPSGLYIYF